MWYDTQSHLFFTILFLILTDIFSLAFLVFFFSEPKTFMSKDYICICSRADEIRIIWTVLYLSDKYFVVAKWMVIITWWFLRTKQKKRDPPLRKRNNLIISCSMVFNWKFHHFYEIKRFAPLIRRLTQMVSEFKQKNNVPNFECEPGQAEHFRIQL